MTVINRWLATLMLQCQPLIVRSKASLGSSREVEHGCGVSFINYLYLVHLIIGQNFCATCANLNQTGPKGTAMDRALQTATRSPILLPELRLLPRAVAAMEVPSSLWPRDPIAWARRQGGEEDFFFESKEKRIWWDCIDASAEQDLLEGYSTCRSPSHQTAKPCSDSI